MKLFVVHQAPKVFLNKDKALEYITNNPDTYLSEQEVENENVLDKIYDFAGTLTEYLNKRLGEYVD